jgi:hypothetical protein
LHVPAASILPSSWTKKRTRNNPKVQALGDVQNLRYHDSCCCFVYFQYADYFYMHWHVPAASSLQLCLQAGPRQGHKSYNNPKYIAMIHVVVWLQKPLFHSLCGVHG